MPYDWFPLHFFTTIETPIYFISGFFVILWFLFLREKAGKPMPNALMKKYSRTPLLLVILWALRASIIFLSVMILALIFVPREYTPPTIPREAYVIALDISKSMETDDVSPSRIEYAKSLLVEKIPDLPASGLIIFAGKTFVLSPLTTDSEGISYIIETTSTDTINQSEKDTSGTNIGDALIQASTLFSDAIEKKHVILITDGRANLGLDPIIAAESLRDQDISLSVIALGSLSGTILTHIVDGKREPLLDASGNTINGDIDMDTLRKISEMTEGKLVHITNSSKNTLESSGIFPPPGIHPLPTPSQANEEQKLFLILAILAFLHLFFSLLFWHRYKTP